MTQENEQLNNPLHGLKLDALLEQLVSFYGFDILAEYTRIKCFKNNPSMTSSLKFLRKTEWARETLERFYLYKFKNLPEASEEEFDIPPRQRIIPAHQKPKEPMVLIRGEAPPPVIRPNNFHQTADKPRSSSEKARKSKPQSSNKKPAAPADPWANAPK
ncbi:VF530 family DNA-binding protein [Thalassotalea sp. PLHSN55]|uniref:VF530 family protein n=1 Tax=Thalassotalea sp. PLHSN55 TaxID=3435888 RepID=UPI003F8254BB